MRTIKFTIEYDGTNYCGWQQQDNGVSIQGTVREALVTMTHEENKLVGASRTDAGVHALGQVAHVTTESTIPCDGFVRGLNSILPPDIRIVAAEAVEEGFHALVSAKAKTYRYAIDTSPLPSALYRDRAWHVPCTLDEAAMKRALEAIVGTHDFEAFKAAGSAVKDAVRTIHAADVRRVQPAGEGTGLIPCRLAGFVVEITGEGFVRHMVRNIVGTLVEIGQGKRPPEDMARIIAARRRDEAGVCAPASGLYLMSVAY